ncbi:hypothetical protein NB717_003791 [Xanthomonas sacchari]|nr:hypothetical protein [Xanthomonas sacchari]
MTARAAAEQGDQLDQPLAPPLVAPRQLDRRQRGRGLRRRQRGGVQIRPRGFGQMPDQRGIADHCGAVAAQCLAQGHQLQRNVVDTQPGLGDAAAPLRADHADAVRVVHVQQRLLGARHQRQRAQRGDVAVHAEHAIGGQHRRTVGGVLELAHRAFGIQMRIATQAAAGQAAGVEQAGVVEPVLHAHVLFLAQQRLLHRQVGDEAAAEQQRLRIAEPVGDLAFQRLVQRVVAAHQVRGGGAGALARGRVLQGGDHFELLRQAQVVVAAEAGQPAAVHFQAHAVAAADAAAHAQAPLRFA